MPGKIILSALVLLGVATACGLGQTSQPAATQPRDQTRPMWSPSEYIHDWLLLGPIDNPPADAAKPMAPGGHAFVADALAGAGGEANAAPKPGDIVTLADGKQLVWKAFTSPADIMGLRAALGREQADHLVAYAFATVNAPADTKAFLSLGSDDSVKVWVNGELVHERRVNRWTKPDDDLVAVMLKQGRNRLLFKVENLEKGWGLVARVVNADAWAARDTGVLVPSLLPGQSDAQLAVQTDNPGQSPQPGETPVLVELLSPAGAVVAHGAAPRGAVASLDTGKLPDGPYEVRLTRVLPDGRRTLRHLPWYHGDARPQLDRLLAEAAACDPASDDPVVMRRRVLGELARSLLGMPLLDDAAAPRAASQPMPAPASAPALAALAESNRASVLNVLLEHAELGTGTADRPHAFERIAYRDPVDNSPQFARVYLPPGYGAAPCPLVVVLHGYNPRNPPYAGWWDATKRHDRMSESYGVIVVEPHGRGNTGYSLMGEADVMRVLDLCMARYKVDRQRVYLMGYSMGGGGTWWVGSRHVDRFAALGPIYGGWDYRAVMSAEEFAKLTPRQRLDEERWSSLTQAEALLATPIFQHHGDADNTVPVEMSRYLVRTLQRWGYPIRYQEHPGKGHGDLGCEDAMMQFLLANKLDGSPAKVRLRALELATARAHWVRVTQAGDPGAIMRAEAEIVNRQLIRVDSENILELELTPPPDRVDAGGSLVVVWNGQRIVPGRTNGRIVLTAAGYERKPHDKRPERCGPLDAMQLTPFVIVRGTTAADPAMRAFVDARANAIRDAWITWQHVAPRDVRDVDLTPEDMAGLSLILVGGPAENAVAAKLANSLGVLVQPDGVTIDGHRFACTDAGVSVLRPHPLNDARYVRLIAGTSAAGMYFTGWFEDGSDYQIVDAVPPTGGDGTTVWDASVASGRFGPHWNFDERFSTMGDAGVRAKRGKRTPPAQLSAATSQPSVWVADLLPVRAEGSFLVLMRNMNGAGQRLTVGGIAYDHGLGVEAWREPSKATYDLSGAAWRRLKATIGIDVQKAADESAQPPQPATRARIVVTGDGRTLYSSPLLTAGSKPEVIDVDIAGINSLTLEVLKDGGNDGPPACVALGDLRLEK